MTNQVLLRVVDFSDAKTPFASDAEVDSTVVVALGADDAGHGSDHVRIWGVADLAAGSDEADSEAAVTLETLPSHFAVSIFEDMHHEF